MSTKSKLVAKEDLICPICYEVPVSTPVVTPCDHFFCRGCITEALKCNQCCPMDRNPVTLDEVQDVDKNGPTWKTWSETVVECKGHELGCSWSGAVQDYAHHDKSCVFGLIESSYQLIETKRVSIATIREILELLKARNAINGIALDQVKSSNADEYAKIYDAAGEMIDLFEESLLKQKAALAEKRLVENFEDLKAALKNFHDEIEYCHQKVGAVIKQLRSTIGR